MGLLNNGVSIIHFDETYLYQAKLERYSHDNIDLRNMKQVNLYCEETSLKELETVVHNRSKKGITFIGSGNYHYVSYLLVKEILEPFTLILFDHHPDLGNKEDKSLLLSCGSWVSYALKNLPLLQQVVIIGPTSSSLISSKSSKHPRVVILPYDGSSSYSMSSILSFIPTQKIYISIDKDVLNTAEAVTNWDQGEMEMNTLTNYLEYLMNHKQVIGIDICGELPFSPIRVIQPNYKNNIYKNETANLKILSTCLKTGVASTKQGA